MTEPTRTVRVQALDLDFEVLARDSIIGPSIERGAWEKHETRLFRAHLEPGARVVDLGANVGWYSTLAVLAGCEVTAFEPVPHIADVCQRNLDRANARGPGKGRLVRAAAGAARGTAHIALGGTNMGDNRVLDEGGTRPGDMGTGETLAIDVERVDDHVEGPARLVKVDTQGSEWLALAGAQRLLAASPRMAMLLEFWPYALRSAEPLALLELLARSGFTIGKATAAPYPMSPARILRQALARDPVKGGLDLYATRGVPFHTGGLGTRLRSFVRSRKEA